MWEKKEDPLWENHLIAVSVLTIITILVFWVSYFVDMGFEWAGLVVMSFMSLILGPIIFKIYLLLIGVVLLLIGWFKEKSQ